MSFYGEFSAEKSCLFLPPKLWGSENRRAVKNVILTFSTTFCVTTEAQSESSSLNWASRLSCIVTFHVRLFLNLTSFQFNNKTAALMGGVAKHRAKVESNKIQSEFVLPSPLCSCREGHSAAASAALKLHWCESDYFLTDGWFENICSDKEICKCSILLIEPAAVWLGVWLWPTLQGWSAPNEMYLTWEADRTSGFMLSSLPSWLHGWFTATGNAERKKHASGSQSFRIKATRVSGNFWVFQESGQVRL